MSETNDKPAGAPAGGGKGNAILGILLPAIFAGAAAFGGARVAGAHAAKPADHAEHEKPAVKPPGPTIPLEPFLLATQDANKKAHSMRIAIAIEFEASVKEEAIKPFTPRIRDAALTYLRSQTYEDFSDSTKTDKIRNELLEKFKGAGAGSAERVLFTDLVLQ